MLFVYRGHEAAVSLTSGETIKGTIAWSWAWGYIRLNDAKALDGGQDVELTGFALIPRSSVALVQVI